MGSCHHDSRVAVIVACRKGKCRYRHQCIVDPDFDPVGSQNACRSLCKYVTLQTAVITDRNSLCAALCLDPVGKALCRLAHNIDIHTVRSCSEHTAQSCSSKLQCHSETILDLFIISFDPC